MQGPAKIPEKLLLETVCQIPEGFSGDVTICINNCDPMVVVQNFLVLNLLPSYRYDVIDVVLALWYSTSMAYAQRIIVDGLCMDTLERVAEYGKHGKRFQVDFGSCSPGSVLNVEDGGKAWTFLAYMFASVCSLQSILSSRLVRET
jgi:hypothetical protein